MHCPMTLPALSRNKHGWDQATAEEASRRGKRQEEPGGDIQTTVQEDTKQPSPSKWPAVSKGHNWALPEFLFQ